MKKADGAFHPMSLISSLEKNNKSHGDKNNNNKKSTFMNTDGISRKSHFKKLKELPSEGTAFYDCSFDLLEEGGTYSLADLCEIEKKYINDLIESSEHFSNFEDVISWGALVVQESPLGMGLLREAAENGWSVGVDDLNSGGFYLNLDKKEIWLDHFSLNAESLGRSVYFRSAFLSTFIRALRDVWHERSANVIEDRFRPEDILMLERVRAADCDTVTIMACWELRGAGVPDIWRYIMGSEEGDMATAYMGCLENDPSCIFDGGALSVTFRQWFAGHARVDGCDHDTMERLDDLLLETTTHNPFGCDEAKPVDVEEMSVLPDGLCYLSGYGEDIITDPFFAGLGDPINQTHFFHIMYDLEVFMVNNVPFRDRGLARKIFPSGTIVRA
jgi:hypothetical protein